MFFTEPLCTKAVVEVSSICHMEMHYIIPVLMKDLQWAYYYRKKQTHISEIVVKSIKWKNIFLQIKYSFYKDHRLVPSISDTWYSILKFTHTKENLIWKIHVFICDLFGIMLYTWFFFFAVKNKNQKSKIGEEKHPNIRKANDWLFVNFHRNTNNFVLVCFMEEQ